MDHLNNKLFTLLEVFMVRIRFIDLESRHRVSVPILYCIWLEDNVTMPDVVTVGINLGLRLSTYFCPSMSGCPMTTLSSLHPSFPRCPAVTWQPCPVSIVLNCPAVPWQSCPVFIILSRAVRLSHDNPILCSSFCPALSGCPMATLSSLHTSVPRCLAVTWQPCLVFILLSFDVWLSHDNPFYCSSFCSALSGCPMTTLSSVHPSFPRCPAVPWQPCPVFILLSLAVRLSHDNPVHCSSFCPSMSGCPMTTLSSLHTSVLRCPMTTLSSVNPAVPSHPCPVSILLSLCV
jgi:hypothetical protein